jgi:hypothetical protein
LDDCFHPLTAPIASSSAEKNYAPIPSITFRTALKAIVSIGLTVGVFYLVSSRTDVFSIQQFLIGFHATIILAVIALAIVATALSVWRLQLIARDLGYRLTVRDAIAAVSLGVLAGSMFFQFVGQLLARGALLSRRGMPVAATITLTIYERAAAAGVSVSLAIAGGWYIFGRVTLDLEHGGLVFLKIITGLALALAAGALLAWGPGAIPTLRRVDPKIIVSILRNIAISAAIQLATMAAYVTVARAVAPNVAVVDLAAAASVVMLAAALPISLAGWGARELSAIFTLGAVGVSNDAALVVAILIGIVSLLVIGAFAVSSLWSSPNTITINPVRSSAPLDYNSLLAWVVPTLAGTVVFFQLYIPVGQSYLNVNLADPLAILGGALFLIWLVTSRLSPRWRWPWLSVHIAAITAVLLLALVHGAWLFGWTSWALTNRFAGWFILLGYGATGAIIADRNGIKGLTVLLRTFACVASAIVILDLLLITLTSFGVRFPDSVLSSRMSGFAQNPNAFAFQLLLALCCSIVVEVRPRISLWVTTICLLGIWFSASRATFIAAPFVIAIALYSGAMPPRRFIESVILACSIVVFVGLIPSIISIAIALPECVEKTSVWTFQYFNEAVGYVLSRPATLRPPLLHFDAVLAHPAFRFGVSGQFADGESSNMERLSSLQGGLAIFLDHPIFGGGLGLFMAEHLRKFGIALVIHSTPLWLLAETGIVGFVVVAAPFVRGFVAEFGRARRGDFVALLIVLILMAFGIVSMAHDMFYQRTFWLLLGATMATGVAKNRQINRPAGVSDDISPEGADPQAISFS